MLHPWLWVCWLLHCGPGGKAKGRLWRCLTPPLHGSAHAVQALHTLHWHRSVRAEWLSLTTLNSLLILITMLVIIMMTAVTAVLWLWHSSSSSSSSIVTKVCLLFMDFVKAKLNWSDIFLRDASLYYLFRVNKSFADPQWAVFRELDSLWRSKRLILFDMQIKPKVYSQWFPFIYKVKGLRRMEVL